MSELWYFTIPGRLDGLNELIKANRSGWPVGAKNKRDNQRIVCDAIYARSLHGFRSTEHPISLSIDWYEPNQKRDPDNIFSGVKYILDAMVEMEVIPNDSQKYVRGISHKLHIDKERPRVEVRMESVEGE